MKRHLYYVYAFVILQIITILLEIERDMRLFDKMAPIHTYTILCLGTLGVALFSKSRHTFDYLLAVVAPLAISIATILYYWIAAKTPGYADVREIFGSYTLLYGIHMATSPHIGFWRLYLLVGSTAFIASFKPFRLTKFIKGKK